MVYNLQHSLRMLETLNDRSVLILSGEDCASFLQGLITKNCLHLKDNELIYTLMLSPHGKYLFDLFLIKRNESFIIDIASDLRDEFLAKIKLYKLRSKIEIIYEPSLTVQVSSTDQIPGVHLPDPRSNHMGFRGVIKKDHIVAKHDSFYHKTRILNLIPEGFFDMVRNISFPLEFGFDKMNAIDFDKGCYVGQELIARTHFKGEIRKKLYLLQTQSLFAPKGTEIYFQQKRIGMIASSIENIGLALLRREDVATNQIKSLIINDIDYKIITSNEDKVPHAQL
jgi:folate-binding protein YgfZ